MFNPAYKKKRKGIVRGGGDEGEWCLGDGKRGLGRVFPGASLAAA